MPSLSHTQWPSNLFKMPTCHATTVLAISCPSMLVNKIVKVVLFLPLKRGYCFVLDVAEKNLLTYVYVSKLSNTSTAISHASLKMERGE